MGMSGFLPAGGRGIFQQNINRHLETILPPLRGSDVGGDGGAAFFYHNFAVTRLYNASLFRRIVAIILLIINEHIRSNEPHSGGIMVAELLSSNQFS
jgi:hypothetical protein